MKLALFKAVIALSILVTSNAFACSSAISVCTTPSEDSFSLIQDSVPVPVLIDEDVNPAVKIASENFVNDLFRVSGIASELWTDVKQAKNAVIIGELGNSELIDNLIASNKIDVSEIEGQWEAYQISIVQNPVPGIERALVIVGSDRRGAVFGTYDLSEKIGVSPWYWFADVPVERHQNLYVTSGVRIDQPQVKYRGIFINDEDPVLSGWAKKQFSGVNSLMYKHVFELILRLKGNYIWPAMWGKAIHLDDPRSTSLADNMGIVLGTSHHEPMTRAHAEWHRYPNDPTTGGAWNYQTNAENLRSFWRKGIERMMSKGDDHGYESLVTVGMRGDGDEPMSEETATQLLETIVADQRAIIAEVTQRPIEDTPQVWALYKEVQDYYDQGMSVPDDVTLLFADDNWGQIRRLPTKDLEREGGFGVYYHFDYVGAPRNYKWINTTQINKVWQQMNLAYQRGAKDIWVVNVGDIKPMEYPIDFFLEMAWSPETMDLAQTQAYPLKWATETFGKDVAESVAQLVTDYSRYASRRKPELINEETFPVGDVKGEYLTRGIMDEYVAQWLVLVKQMEATKKLIAPEQADAFFQLVEFPILALSNLYEMYHAVAWNRKLALSYDARSTHFLEETERTYARDTELTNLYHTINNGKWDGMMNQVHMNYFMWNDPSEQTMPSVVRVTGGNNNIPVQFSDEQTQDSRVLSVDASEYSRNTSKAGITWTLVPDLGQSDGAMISYPQGKAPTPAGSGPVLEYDFSTASANDLIVKLTLGPTLDTVGKEGIKIALAIDNLPIEIVNMNLEPTGGGANTPEKRAWYQAVKDHGFTLSASFEGVNAGQHTLKIYRVDDNVILETIEIDVQ